MTPVVLGWPPGPRLRLDHERFAYAGKFVMSATGKAVLLEDHPGEGLQDRSPGNGDSGGRRERERRGAGQEGRGEAGEDGRSDVLGDVLIDAGDRERLAGAAADADWSLEARVAAAVAFSADRTDADTLRVRYVTVRRDRRGESLGPALLGFVRDRAVERGYERVGIGVNNAFSYEAAYKAGFGWTGEETGLAELVCAWPAPERRSAERYRAGLKRFRDADREVPAAERSFLDGRAGSGPPPVTHPRIARD